LVTVSWPKF